MDHYLVIESFHGLWFKRAVLSNSSGCVCDRKGRNRVFFPLQRVTEVPSLACWWCGGSPSCIPTQQLIAFITSGSSRYFLKKGRNSSTVVTSCREGSRCWLTPSFKFRLGSEDWLREACWDASFSMNWRLREIKVTDFYKGSWLLLFLYLTLKLASTHSLTGFLFPSLWNMLWLT